MRILSHRGYWKTPVEKNSLAALARSFSLGFGTETDLRDCAGRLVVSHDPPLADALDADALFEVYAGIRRDLPLALNIKADGLQTRVKAALDRFGIANYFVFDMSVPDMRGWLRHGMAVFTRHSDLEREPILYKEAAGVWLDAFVDDWIDEAVVAGHVAAGKQVCIVSPELHGREHADFWTRLRAMPVRSNSAVMLCTDLPEDAERFINA